MRIQCCACRRVRHGDDWRAGASPAKPSEETSHGYCPACLDELFEQVDRHYERHGFLAET